MWKHNGQDLEADYHRMHHGLERFLTFVRHFVALDATEAGLQMSMHFKTSHILAKVEWHCRHPNESWLPSPVLIIATDCEPYGPATFIPISQIQCRCAVVLDNVKFDFGEDSVLVIVPLKRKVSCWKHLLYANRRFHFVCNCVVLVLKVFIYRDIFIVLTLKCLSCSILQSSIQNWGRKCHLTPVSTWWQQ